MGEACSTLVTVDRQLQPAATATADRRSPFLKAHLRDGGVLVLDRWQHDTVARVVSGRGVRLDANRVRVDSGQLSMPLDGIALIETNVVERSGAAAAITIVSIVTAGVATVCAFDPKACFGSCPTFYASTGDGREALLAEGFSSSVAPALEATDLDALWAARGAGREVRIGMVNEALETHVVRSVALVAVPRPSGERIVVGDDGAYYRARDLTPPIRCDAEGGDCRAALVAFDGTMHSLAPDASDLATRATLELEFAPPGEGALGLVLSARQTLMSTFVFYQGLAWFGNEAGAALARLDPARNSVGNDPISRRLGRIEVLVQDRSGAWVGAGTIGEAGPLATDTKVVPLPPSVDGGAPVRVRLRGSKGLWRFDAANLARIAPAGPALTIPPVEVLRDGTHDAVALATLLDPKRTLVTQPGDRYDLRFELPSDAGDYELFLSSRGYYLEWMRDEWIAQQDLDAAARILLDPARVLRDMAPEYARRAPAMDSIFWNSRYVRR